MKKDSQRSLVVEIIMATIPLVIIAAIGMLANNYQNKMQALNELKRNAIFDALSASNGYLANLEYTVDRKQVVPTHQEVDIAKIRDAHNKLLTLCKPETAQAYLDLIAPAKDDKNYNDPTKRLTIFRQMARAELEMEELPVVEKDRIWIAVVNSTTTR